MDRLEYAKQSVPHPKEPRILTEDWKIAKSASIGCDGFGFARDTDGTLIKVWHKGGVFIGKSVEIRQFVTIDRGVEIDTVIGDGNKIDHHVHIAHNVQIGVWNTFAAHCVIEGSCEIGDYNTFGAGVIVQRKVKIGNNCIFGSGTVVTKDIPDNSVVVGNPGRIIRNK